jgi:hypothetical protein
MKPGIDNFILFKCVCRDYHLTTSTEHQLIYGCFFFQQFNILHPFIETELDAITNRRADSRISLYAFR